MRAPFTAVSAVNGSSHLQKDSVEADFGCSSAIVLAKHAVLLVGGF